MLPSEVIKESSQSTFVGRFGSSSVQENYWLITKIFPRHIRTNLIVWYVDKTKLTTTIFAFYCSTQWIGSSDYRNTNNHERYSVFKQEL